MASSAGTRHGSPPRNAATQPRSLPLTSPGGISCPNSSGESPKATLMRVPEPSTTSSMTSGMILEANTSAFDMAIPQRKPRNALVRRGKRPPYWACVLVYVPTNAALDVGSLLASWLCQGACFPENPKRSHRHAVAAGNPCAGGGWGSWPHLIRACTVATEFHLMPESNHGVVSRYTTSRFLPSRLKKVQHGHTSPRKTRQSLGC